MDNIFNTETKFNIGDRVKVMARKRKKVKCPFCNGNYEQEVDGDILYCANCDEGIMSYNVNDELTTGTIYGMHVELRKKETDEDDYYDNTYATEEGYKNVDYYISSDDEDLCIGTVNEREVLQFNKES